MEEKQVTNVKRILTAVIAVMIAAVCFGAGFLTSRLTLSKELKAIDFIIKSYRDYYYEETDDVIDVFMSALTDQYSEYYSREEYALVKKAATGSREGLGLSFNTVTNKIVRVSGNSPAEKAGIEPGGIITALGKTGEPLTSVNGYYEFRDELAKIKAYVDITLEITYGEGDIRNYVVQKQEYAEGFVFYYSDSGAYSFNNDDGAMELKRLGDNTRYPLGDKTKTGVILYTGFSGLASGNDGSAGQFKSALDKFKEEGKTCLILDLRDNGGGYVDIMCKITAHLINAENGTKQPAMLVCDKYGRRDTYLSATVDFNDYGFEKIVVLANSGSASASEALIGNLLDYDGELVNVIVEGVEIGDKAVYKTYGKGIMQTTYENVGGDAIKLTTATISWPITKTCIHSVGVTPELDSRVIGETAEGSCFQDGLSLCK